MAPLVEKLTTDQSEPTLIDMRRLGISPNVKMPNPCAEAMDCELLFELEVFDLSFYGFEFSGSSTADEEVHGLCL